MNLVKFLSAANSGCRASQTTPLVSAASRGLTTSDTKAKSVRQSASNTEAKKGNNLSNDMMHQLRHDMQMVGEQQRQLQYAISRAGAGAPPSSLVSLPTRGFAPPKKTKASADKAKAAEKKQESTPAQEEVKPASQADKTAKKEEVPADKAAEKAKQASQEKNEEPKKEQQQDAADDEEDFEQKAEFKTHRRVMFILGKMLKYTCWFMSGVFFYHLYLVTNKDKPEEGVGASDAFLFYAYQARDFYYFLRDLLTKPPVNSLLFERPPMPPGYGAPKTLVLNVTGTLTHSEYKLGVGFEILKRPGLSVFLSQMSQNYEVVLFGDQERSFIEEIGMSLDPNQQIFGGILGRESTIVRNGKYVKDFSYLGRPVKEVVYLDYRPEVAPFHQENCIVLPEFTGDLDDRALYEILPFLRHLAQKPGDVREEIKLYGSENTAANFNAMRMQRRNMIRRQQESGLSGVITNLSKAQGLQTEQQREVQEEMSMNRPTMGKFGSS